MFWLTDKIFWTTGKNDVRTFDNIKNIAVGQGDDYTTGCFTDYNYFNNY